jgi:AcrR family transcriptional regulator
VPPASKPRKRRLRKPRQARAKATVGAIVEAAARILAAEGWARFTTNRVAERAGVSIGSLYEYFPNKQALVDAILEGHLARGEAIVAERLAALGEDRDVEALLAALVAGFVELHEDDPRLHRVLSSEVPVSAALRARAAALTDTLVDALAGALAAADVEAPAVTARLVVDVVDALTHRWIVEPSGPVDAARLTVELTRMIRGYVRG